MYVCDLFSLLFVCAHCTKQEVEVTLPLKGKKGGKGAVGRKVKPATTTVPHSTVTSPQTVLSPVVTTPPQNSVASPSPLLSSQSVGSINTTTILPGGQQQVIKVSGLLISI